MYGSKSLEKLDEQKDGAAKSRNFVLCEYYILFDCDEIEDCCSVLVVLLGVGGGDRSVDAFWSEWLILFSFFVPCSVVNRRLIINTHMRKEYIREYPTFV